MKAKRLVLAGVGLAVILGGTAVVLDQMAAGPPGPSAGSTVPGPDATPGGPASAKAGESAPGTTGTGPGTGTATGGGAGTATGGSADGSSPAPVGREVLPPVSATPTGLPAPSPPPALIHGPLPATASAQGKIVAGFPADVLPFPDGTVVVSTGVASADGALQVAADAIVASGQDSVVGHFQQILGPLKFWSEPTPASEGQRALRFSRGNDSVTLTTVTTGTGSTRFMLLGNLHAAAGE
ncbi:hypothetical protein [Pseudarthrobacter sp. H2]|uniref:hypothetical protein n=1 Tax=Pseudarthrobacter sp. H2 TaxID=3418415 RepID=UPI003CE77F3A